MDKLLAALTFIVALGVMAITFPDGPLAVILGSFCAVIAILVINKTSSEKERVFLQQLFIVSLLLRVIMATATYIFQLQEFFGGDSITYDYAGLALYNSWFGYYDPNDSFYLPYALRSSGSGFGMAYIVAVVYSVIGRNPFAIQLLNSALGASTACLIYVCGKRIFSNIRVAKLSAILVGVFPSLILWSSQGLKDGIICFLIVLAMNALFTVQKRFSYGSILILLISLTGIYTLRFYIFFAFVVAIFGSFFLSTQKSAASMGKQIVALVVITIGLTYLGILQNAQANLEKFGNLETLQNSRADQSRSAESGFGQDIDVSTPTGAIQALPIGLAYILLAPFPWQVANLRQAITMPESVVWWCLIPFLISGIWYTLKNKLRESVAVVLLTLLLTVSYAMFQGNVGTAYRMRAQMQIFYFIFVGVGLAIWQEKRENRKYARQIKDQQLSHKITLSNIEPVYKEH